jgi:hypothetical protein
MLVMNALLQLASQPGCLMRRPTGVAVRLGERMQLISFRSGVERRWVGKFRDLVADDWEVISFDRLYEEVRLMQENAELVQAEQAITDAEANDAETIG